jgi:hypothetical protein
MPNKLPTNMRVLKPTRKRPKAGDIFVFSIRDHEYRWGRVIAVDANVLNFTDLRLI